MNKLILSIGTFDVIFNDPAYTELRKRVEKEIIRVAKAYRIYLPFKLYECSDKDLGLVIKFIKSRMEQFAKRKARLQYFVNEAIGLEKFESTLYGKELQLGLEDEQIQQQQLQQQQFEQQQQNDKKLLEFNQQQQYQQFQQQQQEEFESSNINFDREIEQTFHYEQQQQQQQQQQQVSSLEKEELKQINKSAENVFLTESDLIAQYDQQNQQQQHSSTSSSSSIIIPNRVPINNLHIENKTLKNSHNQHEEEESFDSSSNKTYFESLKPLDNKNVHEYDPNKFTDEDFDYLLTMTFAKEDDISYDSEGEGELATIIPGTLTYDAMKAKEEVGELNEYTNYDRNIGNYVKKICKFDSSFKQTYAQVTGNLHPLNSDLDD